MSVDCGEISVYTNCTFVKAGGVLMDVQGGKVMVQEGEQQATVEIVTVVECMGAQTTVLETCATGDGSAGAEHLAVDTPEETPIAGPSLPTLTNHIVELIVEAALRKEGMLTVYQGDSQTKNTPKLRVPLLDGIDLMPTLLDDMRDDTRYGDRLGDVVDVAWEKEAKRVVHMVCLTATWMHEAVRQTKAYPVLISERVNRLRHNIQEITKFPQPARGVLPRHWGSTLQDAATDLKKLPKDIRESVCKWGTLQLGRIDIDHQHTLTHAHTLNDDRSPRYWRGGCHGADPDAWQHGTEGLLDELKALERLKEMFPVLADDLYQCRKTILDPQSAERIRCGPLPFGPLFGVSWVFFTGVGLLTSAFKADGIMKSTWFIAISPLLVADALILLYLGLIAKSYLDYFACLGRLRVQYDYHGQPPLIPLGRIMTQAMFTWLPYLSAAAVTLCLMAAKGDGLLNIPYINTWYPQLGSIVGGAAYWVLSWHERKEYNLVDDEDALYRPTSGNGYWGGGLFHVPSGVSPWLLKTIFMIWSLVFTLLVALLLDQNFGTSWWAASLAFLPVWVPYALSCVWLGVDWWKERRPFEVYNDCNQGNAAIYDVACIGRVCRCLCSNVGVKIGKLIVLLILLAWLGMCLTWLQMRAAGFESWTVGEIKLKYWHVVLVPAVCACLAPVHAVYMGCKGEFD